MIIQNWSLARENSVTSSIDRASISRRPRSTIAELAEDLSSPEDGDHQLLSGGGGDRQLHAPVGDEEQPLGGLALAEDDLAAAVPDHVELVGQVAHVLAAQDREQRRLLEQLDALVDRLLAAKLRDRVLGVLGGHGPASLRRAFLRWPPRIPRNGTPFQRWPPRSTARPRLVRILRSTAPKISRSTAMPTSTMIAMIAST